MESMIIPLFFNFTLTQAAKLCTFISERFLTRRAFPYQIMAALRAELFTSGFNRCFFGKRTIQIRTDKMVHGFSPYIIGVVFSDLILHLRMRNIQCLDWIKD